MDLKTYLDYLHQVAFLDPVYQDVVHSDALAVYSYYTHYTHRIVRSS